MSSIGQPKLTQRDIARYEKRIAKIDLNHIPTFFHKIQKKLEAMISKKENLHEIHVHLLVEISLLYATLKESSNLEDDLKRRIIFALEYFLDEDDEIPDSIPGIGFLDDYVLVRWVVDGIMDDYGNIFQS